MKKKIIGGIAVLAIAAVAAWNVNLHSSKAKLSDLMLNNVEALADGEGSSLHGRPLLQSTSTGAYKCGNCSGNDCGAVC